MSTRRRYARGFSDSTPSASRDELRGMTGRTFNLPANWRREAELPISQPQETRGRYNEAKCFDLMGLDEEATEAYLQHDPQNIVIFGPATAEQDLFANAICSSRDILRMIRDNLSTELLPCVSLNETIPLQQQWRRSNATVPVDTTLSFGRLDLRDQSVYVPISDIDQAVNSNLQLFEVLTTDLTIPRTASVDFVLHRQWESSNHCQAGSGQRIYRLRPIQFSESATRRY